MHAVLTPPQRLQSAVHQVNTQPQRLRAAGHRVDAPPHCLRTAVHRVYAPPHCLQTGVHSIHAPPQALQRTQHRVNAPPQAMQTGPPGKSLRAHRPPPCSTAGCSTPQSLPNSPSSRSPLPPRPPSAPGALAPGDLKNAEHRKHSCPRFYPFQPGGGKIFSLGRYKIFTGSYVRRRRSFPNSTDHWRFCGQRSQALWI